MQFNETSIRGVFIIDLDFHTDERGTFARTFCIDEFSSHGLDPTVMQCNTSFNRRRGTLRGLHYQAGDASETRLVRCTRGAIYDVVVDLRQDSPTYLQHVGVELAADNGRSVYVPRHCAHGFQTLLEDSEVFYQMSQRYVPGTECGIRFDDPILSIDWPVPVRVISGRDARLPLSDHIGG